MTYFKLFATACLFSLLIACAMSNSEEAAENELKDELYLIHDEVMPKMPEVVRLEIELSKFIEKDSNLMSIIDPALALLNKADEGMMSWMSEFKQPSELKSSKSHEEIMEYLKLEKAKIEQVRLDILASLVKGNTLLDSLKTVKTF